MGEDSSYEHVDQLQKKEPNCHKYFFLILFFVVCFVCVYEKERDRESEYICMFVKQIPFFSSRSHPLVNNIRYTDFMLWYLSYKMSRSLTSLGLHTLFWGKA
jgi:hypothetical protein